MLFEHWFSVAYPGALSETVKTKFVGNFSGIHSVLRKISGCHTRPLFVFIPEDLACWQTPGEEPHGAHPHSAYVGVPRGPQRYDLDRWSQQRR